MDETKKADNINEDGGEKERSSFIFFDIFNDGEELDDQGAGEDEPELEQFFDCFENGLLKVIEVGDKIFGTGDYEGIGLLDKIDELFFA